MTKKTRFEPEKKIIRLDEVSHNPREKVVLCHGHFNIIHPGHIRYLEYARKQGSKLVVSILGDAIFLNQERKNHFSEAERAAGVASLQMVDQVILLGDEGLEKLIKVLNPAVLVLGKEFEFERDYQVSDAHWADTSRHTVVNAVGRYNRDLRDAYRLQNAAMANLSIRDYFRLSLKLFPPKKQIITQPKPVIISEPIIEPVKIISDQTSVVNEHNLQSPTPLNFPTVTQVNTNGIESDNIVIDKKVAAGVGIAAAVGLTLYAISKRK